MNEAAETPPNQGASNIDKKVKVAYEELSKDELLKLVKKQLSLLQKLKNKSDELNRKCLSLEKDRESANNHSGQLVKSNEGLEIEIKTLKSQISKLTQENENFLIVEQELKNVKQEKNKYYGILKEDEQQIECLKMKLESLNAANQCLQEDSYTTKQIISDLKNEVQVLTDARDTALNAFKELKLNSAQGELSELYSKHNDLQNAYSQGIKENNILTKKTESLESELSNLKIDLENLNAKCDLFHSQELEWQSEKEKFQNSSTDASILLRDMGKLQTCINELREENDSLIARNQELRKKSKCIGFDVESYKTLGETNSDLLKQLCELQQCLCEVEGKNSALLRCQEELEEKSANLTGKLENALNTNTKTELELNQCKTELDSCKINCEKLSEKFNKEQSRFQIGIDQALLHGGYADNVFLCNEVKKDVNNDCKGIENVGIIEDTNKNLISQNLYLETEVTNLKKQVSVMTKKLDECKMQLNALNSDESPEAEEQVKCTLVKNESLQKKLEEIEREFVSYKLNSEEEKSVQLKTFQNLQSAFDDEKQKQNDENEKLILKLNNLVKEMDTLELEKIATEKQNVELRDEYGVKCAELSDVNLKLESLILSIKQGVKHKTCSTSSVADRKWQDNISILKVLFDEMNMRVNSNGMKIKNLEAELESMSSEKCLLEDDLIQIRELNQFLEDETTELREEVDQLKLEIKMSQEKSEDSSIYYNKIGSDKCISELYSIEEANELEIKSSPNSGTDIKDFDLINSIPDSRSAISIESDGENLENVVKTEFHQFLDSPNSHSEILSDKIHKENFISEAANTYGVYDDANILKTQDNILDVHESFRQEYDALLLKYEKYESDIKCITEENVSLKTNLDAKSCLVERIHCEMDVLLTKVEELSVEIQEKDSEIERLKNLNIELQELRRKCNEGSAFNVITSLTELKNYKLELEKEINSLISYSNYNFTNLKHDVFEMSSQCHKVMDVVKNSHERNCHMKKVNDFLKSYITSTSTNLEETLYLLKKTISLKTEEMEETEKLSILLEHSNTKCQDTCCEIFENVQSLESNKENLLNAVHSAITYWENHIKICETNEKELHTISTELHNYKTVTVPKLEEMIEKMNAHVKAELLGNVPSPDVKVNTTTELIVKNNEEQKPDVISKSEQLSEVETKMIKFKQIALKLKRELAETKKSLSESVQVKEHFETQVSAMKQELDKMSSVHCQYIQNYQSLQNEYDKIQDENETQKEMIKQLQNNFDSIQQDLDFKKQLVAELESQLKESKQLIDSNHLNKQEMESTCTELGSKIIILESKCSERNEKIKEFEDLMLKSQKETSLLLEENKCFKLQLDQALKEGNKKNLLDLEMADYERSITELNNQLQKKNSEIIELQSELKSKNDIINSMTEEIKYTESLKETQEKRALDLKAALEKSTAELATTKEQKAELTSNISDLQVQLEMLTRQEEQCKLQLSEASADAQQLRSGIETSNENHQRIVRLLETKILAQKEEIQAAYKEVNNINQEFQSYKIRVHSVLKQQKVDNTALSVETDLKEKETMNDKLKTQVKNLSEKLTASNFEYEALQEEYDNLVKRFNKITEDLEKKDRELQAKLEQFNTEKHILRVAQDELSSKHTLQNEMLVSTYKKQIKIMAEEHKQAVSEFQEKLNAAETEIMQLQRDQKSLTATPTPLIQDNSLPFDILTQERQEGEGSENTDEPNIPIRNLSLATIPTSGFLSFEKLLQSPLEPGTPTSFISDHDSEKLTFELNLAHKKNDHLSELLNDSESTNLRLIEQVRVLKDEVRRLERNKEREKHAENLEYLKNVLVKFATLQPCSEKAMLIPVLSTMLKLSPLEQQQLKNVAGDIDPADASAGTGWASYLPRWSGLT